MSYVYQRGKGGREGIVRQFEMDMYTLLHFKWIINKVLGIAQGTLLILYGSLVGGDVGENGYMYICV